MLKFIPASVVLATVGAFAASAAPAHAGVVVSVGVPGVYVAPPRLAFVPGIAPIYYPRGYFYGRPYGYGPGNGFHGGYHHWRHGYWR